MYFLSVMETKHLRVPSRTHFINGAELIASQQRRLYLGLRARLTGSSSQLSKGVVLSPTLSSAPFLLPVGPPELSSQHKV